MKYLFTTILLSAITICTCINAQNHEVMRDDLLSFGNETYAIQINGYTSLVVIGSDGVLITDPANSQRAKILKLEIAKLTKLPVTHVILSHEHYDHIGGTQIFEDAKIVGHEFMEAFFELDKTGEAPRKLDVTFKDYLKISMGNGNTTELYFYAPGDGVTTTIIHLPSQKVVVAADLYMTDEALFPGRATMDDVNLLGTKEIVNRILNELKPRYVLNGHSPDTDPKFLKAYSTFYNDLFEYCNEWITSTTLANGPGAIYSRTLEFAKAAQMPAYSHWKNYHELETYVRRMVMSIHHGG